MKGRNQIPSTRLASGTTQQINTFYASNAGIASIIYNTVTNNIQINVGNFPVDISINKITFLPKDTLDELEYLTGTSLNITPVGHLSFFAKEQVPDGWLFCDGSQVSKIVYSDLFTAIGDTFGEVGGNFVLPDLRGEFIRGWVSSGEMQNKEGTDQAQEPVMENDQNGRIFGKWENYDWKEIHALSNYNNGGYSHHVSLGKRKYHHYTTPFFSGKWQNPHSGLRWRHNHQDEVCPRNVCLLACIKY